MCVYPSRFNVVLKPVRSSGTDGVTFCTIDEEVQEALERLLCQPNRLGELNDCLVLQEYLDGQEYIVDSGMFLAYVFFRPLVGSDRAASCTSVVVLLILYLSSALMRHSES